MEMDEDTEQPPAAQMNGDIPNGDSHAKPSEPAQKRKLKLKYEQYMIIANSIVSYMRNEEDKTDDGEGLHDVAKATLTSIYSNCRVIEIPLMINISLYERIASSQIWLALP